MLQSRIKAFLGQKRKRWGINNDKTYDTYEKQYMRIHLGNATITKQSLRGTKTLRKHAYSNILKILPPKNENFQIKNSDIFHISAQYIDCGYSLEPPRRGDSNKYPQSMFLSRNKKNNVYPCKPQFYYITVGFKGVKTTQACFREKERWGTHNDKTNATYEKI